MGLAEVHNAGPPADSCGRLYDVVVHCLCEVAKAGASAWPTVVGLVAGVEAMAIPFGRERLFGATLAELEEGRMRTAVHAAVQEIGALLKQGVALRTDMVVGGQLGQGGSQLIEGMLRASREAYESKKARHIGTLLARLAVAHDVDWFEMPKITWLAKELTYKEYCLLSLFGEVPDQGFRLDLRGPGYWERTPGPESDRLDRSKQSTLADCVRLGALGLLCWRGKDGRAVQPTNPGNFMPSKAVLTRFGRLLWSLLDLESIDAVDVKAAALPMLESSSVICAHYRYKDMRDRSRVLTEPAGEHQCYYAVMRARAIGLSAAEATQQCERCIGVLGCTKLSSDEKGALTGPQPE